ncbi:MAG: hypothetical protein ACK2UK_03360 [Candidatus Promineifilaceae bacterium]|jgi:hypothetical protein
MILDLHDFLSEEFVAAWLLILSALIFVVGGILYTGRAIWKWPAAQSRSYLYWERGFVMGAILVATMGLVLLTQLLEGAGDKIVAPLAMTLFLVGTILVLAAESFSLKLLDDNYAAIVTSVILAFLGQAAFGISILLTAYLPGWVGWATVIWSLAWLIILPIARPKDMYYPWLHYVAPLIIGIALLAKG